MFIASYSGHAVVVQSNVELPIILVQAHFQANLCPSYFFSFVQIKRDYRNILFILATSNVIGRPEIQPDAKGLRNRTVQTEQFFKRSHLATLDR